MTRASPIAAGSPDGRLRALSDAGSFVADPPAGASASLARFGIAAHDGDGIVTGRAAIGGRDVLVAAQDERFLRGAVGANHGNALASLFARARVERPAAVVLLLASGGVRLHEANAAELALARALTAEIDARASGVPVVAIGVGDVFGGASVLACACDRLALLPAVRFGLSGPAVIEAARGRGELDSGDADAVSAVFGAPARAAEGVADLVADDSETLRSWIGTAIGGAVPFERSVRATQVRLVERIGFGSFDAPWVSVEGRHASLREAGRTLGARDVVAIDAELLACLEGGGLDVLSIREDSEGHEPTLAAERACLSQCLAHHACVLGLARARGIRVEALLTGTGHSAAFFANALQADRVSALPGARVVAMEVPAMARVLRLDPAKLAALVEDDPLLGQPVRHFAALGGATIVGESATPG
ncbi:MAG TPA: biotin-independent malonate decarboxylase subunit gamma [Casimicrobiaceae bacterium]|nr:biotin-independent malonate decarboxylase subunit gamma [Casimicrobiaceae bacterium]